MSVAADNIKTAMTPVVNPSFGVYIDSLIQLLSEIETIARDDDADRPGWSAIVDVNRIPSAGLPYLAQFVGVSAKTGVSDAVQRSWIKSQSNQYRGTVNAIVQAAQLSLTGSKQVILRERFGDPYYLTVITRSSETPNATQTLADIISQKPAGIILTYTVLAGQDYQILFTNRASYQIVFSTYTTYQGVVSDQPGT